ncbi:MAG: universal stress protein [Opitutaceae bacterium]|nr:universal stress protein [Opitutaceae bacterium]
MKSSENGPIVCGTDFSESAAQAATVADALARRLEAPFVLARSADELGQFPQNLRPRLMDDDRPRLAEQAERLRSLGLKFEVKLLHGEPDEGIVQFAARSSARLVVVGASGTGSVWGGRWVLGSTAELIAETSSVPTLVVRSTEPLLAWARGARPLKIFVAMDFTATSDAALRWLAEWRRIGPCEITLGHVHRLPEERAELAMFDGLGLTALTPAARADLERDLREKAGRLLGLVPALRMEPSSGRVDSHLIRLATEAEADLFVLGTHQWQDLPRLWQTSISRRILRDAPMSVACVSVPVAPRGAAADIPTFSRVLVATDFSERAGHAIPCAYAALPREGAVCLLHAVKPGELGHKEELEARLRALIPAAARTRGVTTEVRVIEQADAATAIAETAERFGADLVCIGTHGRTGLVAAVLGSVAQAVIARSPCPVLVVRPPQP